MAFLAGVARRRSLQAGAGAGILAGRPAITEKGSFAGC